MKPTIFIQTNYKQMLGARVSRHSLLRSTSRPDAFDIRYIVAEEQDALHRRHEQPYLRKDQRRLWDTDDLQSFTPTRFLAPQLMDFKGRCLVIDPDVFAVSDVFELLEQDMKGKAIVCRKMDRPSGRADYMTSVMLLDCNQLRHWNWNTQLEQLFSLEFDYFDWMNLHLENPETIGCLEEKWNHFDTLDSKTKMIHFTGKLTQPWKTGLPVDFSDHPRSPRFSKSFRHRLKMVLVYLGVLTGAPSHYTKHPDPKQERFFFELLANCIKQGEITREELATEISKSHLRPDALSLLES